MRVVAVVMIGLLSVPVLAEEREEFGVPGHLSALSDAEIDARLDFLEERLDHRTLYSHTWWKGWTGFYALGVVVQSTQASIESEDGKQADLVVSAVKALGGTINLLREPLQARHGFGPVRAMPDGTREARLARLARAEALLHENAKTADKRYSLLRHGLNVGVNCAGAAIVHGGWGDRTRAWKSAAIGIAVGEMMIWSQPWWPRRHWDEYQHRFSGVPAEPRVSWQLVPMIGGLAVQASF